MSETRATAEHALDTEPEFRALQRGRLVLGFIEDNERQSWAGEGWIRLDGPWIHILADEIGGWQSWPAHNVICIDWAAAEAGGS